MLRQPVVATHVDEDARRLSPGSGGSTEHSQAQLSHSGRRVTGREGWKALEPTTQGGLS